MNITIQVTETASNSNDKILDVHGNPMLSHRLSLQEEIASLARTRIKDALRRCDGNKTKAAKMLGLPSYQTFSNWENRYCKEDK